MEGSFSRRSARVVRHLAREPRHAGAYLAHLPLWKRGPLDVGLPWFSYGSIRYLDGVLRPTHRVFEYGSGGSTLYFARRARDVVSVENDPVWHERVRARLFDLNLTNADCQLHAFDNAGTGDYATLPYFSVLQPGVFDVIVVDGFCGDVDGRFGALRLHSFAQACAKVRRPGGMVILDDYWMFPEARDIAVGSAPKVFQSVGPCRYGVTSTAVFHFDQQDTR